MSRLATITAIVHRALDAVRVRPVATLVASIAGLALLLGSLVVVRLNEETTQEALTQLSSHAAAEAADIDDVVGSATRDLRLASRNVVFGDALAGGTGPVDTADRVRVEAAITYLGQRYAVDEICLIRRDGLEVARFNGGAVAAVADLSPDKSQGNPAFIPTLGLADDTSYRTQAYISPDSNRWVLGLATPIIRSGEITGLLHFELPIAAMAEAIADPFGATGYSFIVDRSGHLLTHPRIAEFRAAGGLPTDESTADFPPASALGSREWISAIDGIRQGLLTTGRFTDRAGSARFAAVPILSD